MPELPTGTVTFVFTDVDGSTRLVRELGDSYVDMIAAHRRLVREALEEHSGFEVDSRGDEFLLAFRRPTEAVAAARAIQERHDWYPWPGEHLVRDRIGHNTREPADGGMYFIGTDRRLVA